MNKHTRYLLLGISIGFLLAFTSARFFDSNITTDVIREASKIIGIGFTEAERDSMISELEDRQKDYKALHSLELANSVPLSLVFDPVPAGKIFERQQETIDWNIPAGAALPGCVPLSDG